MTIKTMPILTAAAAALAMTTVMALDLPTFSDLDVDGNGYIDRSEAAALPCLSRNFEQAERSDQRGLDPAEYRKALEQFCR